MPFCSPVDIFFSRSTTAFRAAFRSLIFPLATKTSINSSMTPSLESLLSFMMMVSFDSTRFGFMRRLLAK